MRHYIFGLPLDAISLEQAAEWVLGAAGGSPGTNPDRRDEPRLVVTLNPEIVVRSREDQRLASALRHADLSVADGVGVAWAARLSGYELPGRVPGVDLTTAVLARAGDAAAVFLLGGRPGVADAAGVAIRQRFGSNVVGSHHGYFGPDEEEAVCQAVRASGARLLLAGLGDRQEAFLHEHRAALGANVMIGVGGTLDVLSGSVRRMPAWTTRLGVEWFFRVLLDPRRWRRLPRLWRFAWMTLRSAGG